MRRWRSESALDLYNVAFAVVLFATPWLFKLTNSTAKVDFWVCSAVVVAISLGAIFAYANWEEWLNLLFGIWLIASPWILGFQHARAMHFAVAIGALVAFMAILELWLMYEKNHPFTVAATPPHS